MYFENALGEQWVAALDADCVRVAGGDIGWSTLEVCRAADVEMAVRELRTPAPVFCNTVVNNEEAAWLVCVLLTAASFWRKLGFLIAEETKHEAT